MEVAERVRELRAELSAHPGARLIAVSKGQPVEKILEAYGAGQRDFGENYVQEVLEKDAELRARGICDIRWHFIGRLQTNKVRQLLPVVSVVHVVSSEKLAREISRRWMAEGRDGTLPVFFEVNVDREESKGGFDPEALPGVAAVVRTLPGLEWRGLMCIPSPEGGRSGVSFRRLAELARLLGSSTAGELSMGMSEDYRAALREGAAAPVLWVRIGTGIFGPRPSRL